ncbi:MAG: DUF1211 domain-containing protein [Anaerolineae bacterium]|nr:DUF1211 domain-containing protein [Anaerolineae bacterium]
MSDEPENRTIDPGKQKFVFEGSLDFERVVFFSDAVFAIAITLLALELRLPELHSVDDSSLFQALIGIWPRYLGFFISFWSIGSFWLGHHRKFSLLKVLNRRLIWLNLLFLMSIIFIPFPTSVISEYGNRTATIFYALSMIFSGCMSAFLWFYAAKQNKQVEMDISADVIRHEAFSSLMLPGVFLLSIFISLIDADLAKFSWLLLIPAAMIFR